MLQQLQLESGESFDFKQGYESAIYEVHKQYNLIRKKNIEVPTKKSVQIQTKKIAEAPVTKILQILPRGTQETASPKIVDITSAKTKNVTVAQTIQNDKIQNKIAGTQIELPSANNEDKSTQTTIAKEYLAQLDKTQFPFNIKTEITKLKISVPLTKLVKNES